MHIEDIKISHRPGRHGDEEAICRLWQQLFDFHAELDPIFTPSKDGREHYWQWVKYHLNDSDSIVMVSEVDGFVAAYCLAQVKSLPPILQFKRIGIISDMAVDQKIRNRRIGRELYQRVEKELKKRQVSRIELKTSTLNPLSNYFWEKVCGFEEFVKIRYKEIR